MRRHAAAARGPARGRIVNITSQHGMVGAPGHAAYAVSKAGLIQLTRQIRDQERDEIRRAVDSLLRTTGQRARGWMVRSFPTVHTRELLVEHGGFVYDSERQQRRASLLRRHAGHAVPGGAVQQGA